MRFDYRDWALGIDPHNLVFIDESGINLGMILNPIYKVYKQKVFFSQ
jgi:hypothetical protein